MKLLLKRTKKAAGFTEGRLFLDGEYMCDTLEDSDRGLSQDMPLDEIKKKKIYGQTAIPAGTYRISLSVPCGMQKKYSFYKDCIPRLLDVPGYDGILIHCGNTVANTSGCILVGERAGDGLLRNSKAAYSRLRALLEEPLTITIDR